ncbi:hypothetical protein V8G54_026769 [Vigna mungo]|uniref:Uncharacterized protein n=1 Tax=Vigna mungo TaxID=3915 RepID=A0AAQ3N168_VIGMU
MHGGIGGGDSNDRVVEKKNREQGILLYFQRVVSEFGFALVCKHGQNYITSIVEGETPPFCKRPYSNICAPVAVLAAVPSKGEGLFEKLVIEKVSPCPSQFLDLTTTVEVNETVKEFLRRYFIYRDDCVGVVVGVVVGFANAIYYHVCSFCKGDDSFESIELKVSRFSVWTSELLICQPECSLGVEVLGIYLSIAKHCGKSGQHMMDSCKGHSEHIMLGLV